MEEKPTYKELIRSIDEVVEWNRRIGDQPLRIDYLTQEYKLKGDEAKLFENYTRFVDAIMNDYYQKSRAIIKNTEARLFRLTPFMTGATTGIIGLLASYTTNELGDKTGSVLSTTALSAGLGYVVEFIFRPIYNMVLDHKINPIRDEIREKHNKARNTLFRNLESITHQS